MASKGVYIKLVWEITKKGLMPVGSMEDWATLKRIARLNCQGGDWDCLPLSDLNPTIGWMSHTLTTSTAIMNLTFQAIWRELVSLVIGNRKTFHPNPKMHHRPLVSPLWVLLVQLSCVMTSVTFTSLPQIMSNLFHLLWVQEIPHS